MTTLQIILSDAQEAKLRTMEDRTGKTAEELVHEVLDDLLGPTESIDWKAALRKGCGLWKDRTDL